MKIQNAKSLPQRFYGLHFSEGVAHYPEHKATIYISSNTAKKMDATYSGKPIFVRHVDEYSLENIQNDSDGWIVRSFYNPPDGKHWTEFLAVSDRAKEAIADGWRLSNSYKITQSGAGGVWHDVPYDQEVLDGEGDHIALVESPRYDESIILTPEQFKEYNEKCEREIQQISNSKGESAMFFKKKIEKVENSKELLEMSITLPKSKVEKTVQQIVNEADEAEATKEEKKYANGDHFVKVGENEMKVSDLVEKYQNAIKEDSDEEIENEDSSSDDVDKEKDNEGSEDLEKEIVEKAKNGKQNFEELQKAHKLQNKRSDEAVYESHALQLKRGKERY